MAVPQLKKTARIGRYPLMSELGSGVQGSVYLARDPELDRLVAIKLLNASNSTLVATGMRNVDDAALAEGRNLGRLHHPNIISIFDVGQLGTRRYLVFEYVKGHTLAQILKKQPRFGISTVWPLMRQIVDAIAHAHAQGVIHLDLNPSNVMIDEHRVPRVMDFGLSRLVARGAAHGVCMGTPLYMAPEQYGGGNLGPHSDVFALGLILFRLLTGESAYKGRNVLEIGEFAQRGNLDFGRLTAAGVPSDVEATLRAALARTVSERLPDGQALLKRMDALAPGKSATTPGAPPPAGHGTIEFLLRRMRLKQELPALSATLVEVNRLTGNDARTSARTLAQVVLRDQALSNRLLRLANSAFYGVTKNAITTVSEAVVRLGFDQVRVACNALLYIGRLQGADDRARTLVDVQVEGFLGGLIARYFATRAGLPDPESAFLCGMFRRLGETLTLYCFPEESAAIAEQTARTGQRNDAYRDVLGLAPAEIGMAVGQEWKLPPEMVHAMQDFVVEPIPAPRTLSDRLALFAALGEDLCHYAVHVAQPQRIDDGTRLAERYRECLVLNPEAIDAVLRAAIEKLAQFEPVLGIKPAQSTSLRRLHEYAAQPRPQLTESESEIPATA